jgi:hypothetical protein
MSHFTEADKDYRAAIEATGLTLADALASARVAGSVDLTGTDITQAILLRLKAFFAAQSQIKTTLQKRVASPAADFFVEAVSFYFTIAFEQLAPSLCVISEKKIIRHRNGLRPDISLWCGDKVVAAVECKTQLGWNRNGWLSEFEERENTLHEFFPDAQLFQVVLMGSNWSGFGTDERIGRQFFVLLDSIQNLEAFTEHNIVHPIEALIEAIQLHAGA